MGLSCGPNLLLWVAWGVNAVLSIVYLAVSLNTFYNLQQVRFYGNLNTAQWKDALSASCMMGFLVILFFLIYSFFILLGRMFRDLKLAFGIMLGTCVHTAFFMLLAGLVLHSSENVFQRMEQSKAWSSHKYNAYVATFAFSYALCASHNLLFILLLVYRQRVYGTKEETYKVSTNGLAPGAPTPGAPTSAPSIQLHSNHGFGANNAYGNAGGAYSGAYGANV